MNLIDFNTQQLEQIYILIMIVIIMNLIMNQIMMVMMIIIPQRALEVDL